MPSSPPTHHPHTNSRIQATAPKNLKISFNFKRKYCALFSESIANIFKQIQSLPNAVQYCPVLQLYTYHSVFNKFLNRRKKFWNSRKPNLGEGSTVYNLLQRVILLYLFIRVTVYLPRLFSEQVKTQNFVYERMALLQQKVDEHLTDT